jgi:hypothetical protein
MFGIRSWAAMPLIRGGTDEFIGGSWALRRSFRFCVLRNLSLRSSLSLHPPLFLPLHFLLALLKSDSCHGFLLRSCYCLPTWFAWLAYGASVVISRPAILPAAPSTSALSSTATIVAGRTAPLSRASLIHREVSAAHFLPVERRNRPFRIIVVCHFHEAEAARSARFSVHCNVNTFNLAEGFKHRS